MEFPDQRLTAADQLGVVTNDVARTINAHARSLLEGTGIEESAMRIMAELVAAETGSLRPSALATLLHVDLSTVSRQIRAATLAGLVETLEDPNDRRATRVRLTPHGDQSYHHVRQRRARLLAGLLDDWDDTTITQLLTLLTTLAQSFRPADPAMTPRAGPEQIPFIS